MGCVARSVSLSLKSDVCRDDSRKLTWLGKRGTEVKCALPTHGVPKKRDMHDDEQREQKKRYTNIGFSVQQQKAHTSALCPTQSPAASFHLFFSTFWLFLFFFSHCAPQECTLQGPQW